MPGRVLLLAAMSAFALLTANNAYAHYARSADGSAVATEEAGPTLSRDSLVVSLQQGEAISLLGLSAHAEAPTRAMAALSATHLTLAVAAGRISTDNGVSAGPGEALILALDTGELTKRTFDAARLAASASPGAADLLAADLETAAARQQRLRWWGLIEPTYVNMATPPRAASLLMNPAISQRIEALREALILNPVEAMMLLDPMEQRSLQSALGAIDGANAGAVSWFFRGASAHPGTRADMVGFYNPIADAWLLVRVAYATGAWRVTDAALYDAAALRGVSAPYWAESASDALTMLAANQHANRAAFAHLSSVAAPAPRDSFETVVGRMRAWASSTSTWRADAPNAAATEHVRQAITRGRVARLAPVGATWRGREIDALPQAVRATFAVTAAAPRGDGATVFLISPLAPEIIIVLDMRGHEPAGLSVVNLANAASSGAAP